MWRCHFASIVFEPLAHAEAAGHISGAGADISAPVHPISINLTAIINIVVQMQMQFKMQVAILLQTSQIQIPRTKVMSDNRYLCTHDPQFPST